MQRCGEYYAGRCLLGGHRFAAPAPPPVSVSVSVSASAQSVDAQRAHLERVLAATTTVLFLASVSYIALSTLYGCIQAGSRRRREQGGHGDSGALAPSAAACELTKRALEEIPVHVVVQIEVEEEEADCAVCLAEYAAGDEVRVLPACRHGFHKECVDRWLLTRAPTCPVCRAPVGPVDQPDAKEDCATGHADADRGGGIGVAGARVLPAMWP